MRLIPILLRLVVVISCGLLCSGQAAEPSPRPNIVFILADDLGYGDLSCYGGQLAPTPNLDRLAREGTRFTQYYSASPICSPSRAGLITGMAPARWRITSYLQARAGNRACEQADFLAPNAPSLPRVLKEAGYATAHFGKWHLGGGRDVTDAPKFSAYGYDEHAGTWESPEPHPDITAGNWIWSANDKVKRWQRSEFFVAKTLDFIGRRKGQPCFVNLWLDDVHTPWVPEAGAVKKDNRANFQRVLVEMDRQIGRLLDGLADLSLDGNTLVIFTSDNGALPTLGGIRSRPLRGSKLSLYEGGIRMPFIVRWPGHVQAGRVDEETVLCALDMFPTLCAIAGAPLPKEPNLDGEEMSPAVFGRAVTRTKPLFWEYGRNNSTAFKFPAIPRDRSPNVAMRDGKWKLLFNANATADAGRPELYDMIADIAETTNLAAKEPEIAARLSEKAHAWRKSLP
jgi:arylsulfatase A-like enzyme